MPELHYLVIEGPLGAGKTTLAKMLAQDLGGQSTLECPEENPFLGHFYQEPAKYAFQAQLFFLLSRYRQQKDLAQQEPTKTLTVCDYLFAKDQIFAALNLTEEELSLYRNIYQLLNAQLPKPDLVLFLQANPEILHHRIKRRKFSYEKGVSLEYISAVSQAYSDFFFRYNEAPVLVANCSDTDFVSRPSDYEFLKREIFAMAEGKEDKHYVTIDGR